MGFGVNASPTGWVGFLDMVRFGTVYFDVLFKFCDYQKKNQQTRKNKENAVVCIS